MSVSGDVIMYARALAELESCRPAHLNAAVAANGASLAGRIARLLGQSRPPARSGLAPGVLVSATLLLIAACGLFGQSATRPAFQVASVKPSTSGVPFHIVRPQPGGRLTAQNAPLLMLIQNAYAVQAYQVVGGPAWIHTDGYDIEAKPESQADRQQVWLMLQTLLADRFKLALHRETRDLPVYTLTTARGGIKAQPSKPGACPSSDQSALPGSSAMTPCGMVRVTMASAGVQMEGSKIPMAEFIRVLAGLMGRPVIDKSRLTGEFEVHVSFIPDENTVGLPRAGGPGGLGDPGAPPPPSDPNLPNIFAALQEQLGLRLASTKGPVEVLVMDHVERPAAN